MPWALVQLLIKIRKYSGYRLPLQFPIMGPPTIVHRGGRVTLWDIKTSEPRRKAWDSPDPIVAIAFRENETGLATLDRNFTYKLLTIEGPEQLAVQNNKRIGLNKLPSPQTSFSRDGMSLCSLEAMAGDKGRINIKLFDGNKRRLRIIPTQRDTVPWSIAMSSDGRLFVTAGRNGLNSVWDFDRAELLHSFRQPEKRNVLLVSLDADGRLVATCDDGGRLCLWDLKEARLIGGSVVPTRDIRAMQFAGGFLTVVSGAFRGDSVSVVMPLLIQTFNLNDALREP